MGSKDYSPLYPIFTFNAFYNKKVTLCKPGPVDTGFDLLKFHLGTRFFKLRFNFFGLFFWNAFFHRFGGFIN